VIERRTDRVNENFYGARLSGKWQKRHVTLERLELPWYSYSSTYDTGRTGCVTAVVY
jgi:hypothetical protein